MSSIDSPATRHLGKKVKLGRDVKVWHLTYIGDNTIIRDVTKIGSLVHTDYDVKICKNYKIEGKATYSHTQL